jgi:hypothetical protein
MLTLLAAVSIYFYRDTENSYRLSGKEEFRADIEMLIGRLDVLPEEFAKLWSWFISAPRLPPEHHR